MDPQYEESPFWANVFSHDAAELDQLIQSAEREWPQNKEENRIDEGQALGPPGADESGQRMEAVASEGKDNIGPEHERERATFSWRKETVTSIIENREARALKIGPVAAEHLASDFEYRFGRCEMQWRQVSPEEVDLNSDDIEALVLMDVGLVCTDARMYPSPVKGHFAIDLKQRHNSLSPWMLRQLASGSKEETSERGTLRNALIFFGEEAFVDVQMLVEAPNRQRWAPRKVPVNSTKIPIPERRDIDGVLGSAFFFKFVRHWVVADSKIIFGARRLKGARVTALKNWAWRFTREKSWFQLQELDKTAEELVELEVSYAKVYWLKVDQAKSAEIGSDKCKTPSSAAGTQWPPGREASSLTSSR